MKNLKNNKQIKGMLLTAGIALLSLLFVFAIDGFFPLGNGSIVALDLNSQYTPLLYRFYDVVTGTKNIAVDFHIGGGINLYSDTLTELINPFNYLLLLFGRANIYKTVNLLLILYVTGAASAAYYALSKIYPKAEMYLKITFSIAYGMSYFVAYQYEIIRWMYIVLLFPFFVLALKRMLEKEKPFAFIILLAYIFALSLQFGVQLCLFSFVYSACYLVNENPPREQEISDRKGSLTGLKNESDRKRLFAGLKSISGRKCLITGVSFISAILIASPSVVPAVVNIINSARSTQNSSILTVITHHGLNNILERILEISNPVVVGVILIAVWVLKKDFIKKIKRNKVVFSCFIILVVTVILEPSNLLWHLGSYQCFPVRYGYAVVWMGIMLAFELFDACRDKLREKEDKSENIIPSANKTPLVYIIICTVFGVIAFAVIIGFVYMKRLMFAQAFSTLDISGVCKKETILLYGMLTVISMVSAWSMLESLRNSLVPKLVMVAAASVMGIVWFMAILLPQNSEARIQNEKNYIELTSLYEAETTGVAYAGHIRETEQQSLNSALVSGAYSMSAYVPSGESLEYVSAMNSLGYETPWISVSQKGGSELSDRLLGLEEGFYGAMVLTKEEMEQIKTIGDLSEHLANKEPAIFLFNNKLGRAYVIQSGTLSGYVLLPMAYMKGWKTAYGNVTNYLGGLLAIEIDDRLLNTDSVVNRIELTFEVPGLREGIILCVIGMLITVVMLAALSDFLSLLYINDSIKLDLISRNTILDKLAKVVYIILTFAFALLVYILPAIGLISFVGAKAAGKDITPYLEITKVDDSAVHTLLSQTMTEEGVQVLIAKNNLMNDKGVKVTSSDEESGYFRASKAADGNKDKESRWSSANDWENCDHYLQADFKSSRKISAVNIYWERTNASNYCIEVSEDGKEWTNVRSFSEPATTNPQVIYFEEGIQGRYLRLHVTDVTRNEEDLSLYYQNVSVLEMEVYDDECDSFVIETPQLTKDRNVPIPAVPDGYTLKVGGVNYDNLLLDNGQFAWTISPVEINLGYELYCGNEKWDITGFDVVLPPVEEGEYQDFPFANTTVREWRNLNGTLSFEGKEELVEAIKNREDNQMLCVEIGDNESLGDEGYEIGIYGDKITISANGNKGIYWGRVTLSKMIEENSTEWTCGVLRDYPEYAVRGFVLDVARRPFTMEMLYKMLDVLSDNYMNTFQIHLSDNAIISVSEYDGTVDGARGLFSAFRLESEVAAGDKKLTSDFYYTDEEFRKFIADAKAVGIDVVPEIDTPAHSLAITKLFPELGYSDYPELADTLDVSKPEVLEFATDLWSEYLLGDSSDSGIASAVAGFSEVAGASAVAGASEVNDTSEEDEISEDDETSTVNETSTVASDSENAKPLFEECDVLHLGMDEFYGDSDAYSKYIANLCTSVKDMAPDKTIRVWASLSYSDVNTSALNRNVEMMVWNPTWSDPLDTYNDGFGIINCLNKNLYIIVDGGNDRIDVDNLKNNWEPNLFYDDDCKEEIPKWSPRMLGACYSMWNDNYCQNMTGPDDDGIMDRFEEPLEVLSNKLWGR